jgi:hypothetical protein
VPAIILRIKGLKIILPPGDRGTIFWKCLCVKHLPVTQKSPNLSSRSEREAVSEKAIQRLFLFLRPSEQIFNVLCVILFLKKRGKLIKYMIRTPEGVFVDIVFTPGIRVYSEYHSFIIPVESNDGLVINS